MTMVFKQCVICKAEKDTTNFHKKQHGKYGVSSRCKPCDYEYSKKYWKESSKRYREKNREKQIDLIRKEIKENGYNKTETEELISKIKKLMNSKHLELSYI